MRSFYLLVVLLLDSLSSLFSIFRIPPPAPSRRPDKHATRALEEATAHQSAEFAMQRANELQAYLNQLIQHPIATGSPMLRLFLALQDDLGTAWPECSSNALTRIANAGVGAAVKVSENATLKMGNEDVGEDNAELMALQHAESVRMGAVLQAVPKLEGAVTLVKEQSDLALSVGMEMGRAAKDVEVTDRELGQPLEILSAGLLRSGRRSKRLALEWNAAVQNFVYQYKMCRYERMAFSDRRTALQRRYKERSRADHRASALLMQQRQQQHLAAAGQFSQMAQQAVMMDTMATELSRECDAIGERLKMEVHRISLARRVDWNASTKVIASSMKEAVTERVAIWEAVRENFLQAFPDYDNSSSVMVNGAAVVGSGGMNMAGQSAR
jgi:PX domain